MLEKSFAGRYEDNAQRQKVRHTSEKIRFVGKNNRVNCKFVNKQLT